MLVNGEWQHDWHPFQNADSDGRFQRQTSSIRHWITPDGSAGPTGDAGFEAEPDRYHLYVALICPWASRTLMVRALKGLEGLISVSVVEPELSDQGWKFAPQDELIGADYLHQVYSSAVPDYTGRATVPVLWDKKRNTMVNNESADIVQMLNSAFDRYSELGVNAELNLRPSDIDQDAFNHFNQWLYNNVNNGVYKTGFAQSQLAYAEAVHALFKSLDQLEERLTDQTWLWGDQLTESDIRLFVTLIRFDAAYYGLFKTNLKTLQSYPQLTRLCQQMLNQQGVRQTINIDHIKRGYYSIKALNPTGIVPQGPDLNYLGIQK